MTATIFKSATTSIEPWAPGARPASRAPPSTSSPFAPPSTSRARASPRTSATTLAAAASLLARANALLPRESLERLELLPKLAAALVYRGEVAAAQAMLAEGYTTAVELGEARLAARAKLAAGLALLWTDAAVPPEQMLRDIEEAVPVLEQAGDYEGLAMAEMLRFHALDRADSLAAPAVRFPLAMAYARRANARHLEHYVMGWICITLPRGSCPSTRRSPARPRSSTPPPRRYTRASAIGALGLLRAMKGEFDDARALVEEDRRMLEELGARHDVAAHAIAVSEVEAIAGDDAAAERILRAGLEAVTAFGDEHSATNVAWRLGLALARQGRYDEAEPFVRVAQRSGHRGFWVDLWWRVVLALIEAHRGNGSRASELVDEVTARLASVDESGFHADALLECADCAPGNRTRRGGGDARSPRRLASPSGSGMSSRSAGPSRLSAR